MTQSLPVLMYHYISRKVDGIAMPPETFEQQVRTLTRAGYRAVGLDEAVEYFASGKPLPGRCCLLSFDDGFLDNYVHAWPILKKYGQKGVVFAVAGKMETASTPRPTLEDIWEGKIQEAKLPQVDAEDEPDELGLPRRRDLFINWEEARLVEASGAMHLAAHSFKHRRVFAGPAFEGFFEPGPRRHTFDRIEGLVPWGLPRFPTRPALSGPAFLPSMELLETARSLVPQDYTAACEFFQDSEGRALLARKYAELPMERLGRCETQEEYHGRIRAELTSCKALLEDELGRPRRHAHVGGPSGPWPGPGATIPRKPWRSPGAWDSRFSSPPPWGPTRRARPATSTDSRPNPGGRSGCSAGCSSTPIPVWPGSIPQ